MTEQKNNWTLRRRLKAEDQLRFLPSFLTVIQFLLKLELYEIFLNLSRQSSSTRFALNSSMLPKRRKYYILYSNHYYLLCSRKKKRKGSSLKTYVII